MALHKSCAAGVDFLLRGFVVRYLMPWELPKEDVDQAWSLLGRKTLRWEKRLASGTRLALEEVRV